MDCLVVEIAERRAALRTGEVREVLALRSLTPVPLAPPMLAGLAQVRGQVVPVLDLAEPPRAPKPSDSLVIVEHGETRAAILVDRVLGVERRAAAEPLDLGALFERLRVSVRAAGRRS
jgi:chemotaxis signal transduction protein